MPYMWGPIPEEEKDGNSCKVIHIVRTGPSSKKMKGYTCLEVSTLIRSGIAVVLEDDGKLYYVQMANAKEVYAAGVRPSVTLSAVYVELCYVTDSEVTETLKQLTTT